MVHYTDDGNITVVSILYRHGKPDHFLCQIKDKLAELSAEGCKAEKGDPLPVGVVNMKELMQDEDRYFRYVGSLTAPPCTENVIWNILGEIREMTKEQAVALMAPLEKSYRQNRRRDSGVSLKMDKVLPAQSLFWWCVYYCLWACEGWILSIYATLHGGGFDNLPPLSLDFDNLPPVTL
uniref:Bifunctional monodehydroascorbate reductase and carbonic anhydrase nectarin-3 n=1 Tax=Aegilops tauschii TaxID=37682 RepID=M8ASA1_AEGTA